MLQKIITGVAVVGLALVHTVPEILLWAVGEPSDALWVPRTAVFLIALIAGLASGIAGIQALRATNDHFDRVLAALDLELLFWQIFTLVIGSTYVFIAGGLVYIITTG